jgi:DNA-directed RNA polymerase I, II, and III subunit RPABC2
MSKFASDFDDIMEDDSVVERSSDEDEDDVKQTKNKKMKSKVVKKTDSDEESEINSDEDASENSDAESDIVSDDEDGDEDEFVSSSAKELESKSGVIGANYAMDLDEEDSNYDDDDNYLQKFDDSLKTNVISEYHPEMQVHNNDEVDVLSRVVRNENGIIIDPLHRTLPFLTKYEKSRILGERAKQLNSGAKPFVEVDASVIDGYLIALKEFEQKKIPFIIKRPLPNGGCEYWKFQDLEII